MAGLAAPKVRKVLGWDSRARTAVHRRGSLRTLLTSSEVLSRSTCWSVRVVTARPWASTRFGFRTSPWA